MKKLFIILLLFISGKCFSQDLNKPTYDIAKQVADNEIALFSKTLDSSVSLNVTHTGNFDIDTVSLSNGGFALYQISITGLSGINVGTGVRLFSIKNVNGTYTLMRMQDLLGTSGIFGFSWNPTFINNNTMVVVRLTVPSTTTVNWIYKRSTL